MIPTLAAIVALATFALGPSRAVGDPAEWLPRIDAFEREMEGLRRLLCIPGLQVAVVREDRVVLERAYGYADLKAKAPMTTDHLIEIASVTKTMTAVVMMQLVAEGKVSLDDRVVKYPFIRWFYPTRISPEVRLRHVLSHTSQGPPGETFCYQGNRFGFVFGVFGTATPEKFLDGEAVARRVLEPLHMEHTLPRPGVKITDAIRTRLATPYDGFDAATGAPIPVRNPPEPKEAYPSVGFFSNVKDLARYAIALQNHILIPAKSHEIMEAPAVTSDGRTLPYGIGCFTQTFAGQRIIWHYGYGDGNSALMLRVPDEKVAMVVLANSGNMSGATRLGYGDVLDSPFAIAFLKHFVFASKMSHESPSFDGDLARIRASIAELSAKNAHQLYFEEVFTQSVIRELMAGPNRDSSRAQALLRMIQELRPQVLADAGLAGLEVLSRFDDPELNPATETLIRALVRSSTTHPAALYYAAQFFDKTGRQAEALRLLRRLADSEFEDDGLTLDACIRMGDHDSGTDPKRARDYYWRAVRIGFASPNYPRVKMDRAIALLNALDHR